MESEVRVEREKEDEALAYRAGCAEHSWKVLVVFSLQLKLY